MLLCAHSIAGKAPFPKKRDCRMKIVKHYIVTVGTFLDGLSSDVGVVREPSLDMKDGYFLMFDINDHDMAIGVKAEQADWYKLKPVFEE